MQSDAGLGFKFAHYVAPYTSSTWLHTGRNEEAEAIKILGSVLNEIQNDLKCSF